MQSLTLEHFQLLFPVAVKDTRDAVPWVESFMVGVFHHAVDGIGRNPYALSLADAFEASQTVQQNGVVGTNEYSVVPAAGANDSPFRFTLSSVSCLIVERVFNLSQIFGTYRQVCRVYIQSLPLSPLDALMG